MIENYSLWDKLKSSNRPIFLYGTGNGADKIISNLERYGAKLDGIFASDGFVRDREFHGMRVRSYSDVIAEYGNEITVLLAFGTTLSSVYEFIRELDQRHELIIPDVPLYGGELFDMDYFVKHREVLDKTRKLFSDEKSKQIFDDAINFRLTGKLSYLSNVSEHTDTLRELFGYQKLLTLIDAGAFKGDSTRDFAEALCVEKILAIEADSKTYLKLKSYAEAETRCKVIPVNAAVWDSDTTINYISSASRGSGEAGKNKRAREAEVRALTLDTISASENVDFIKLDIEGAEAQAILGAAETLKRHKPSVEVSLYHRTDDLFELPLKLHELLPNHRLYLRRIPCIPMWDLNLYAVRQ